MTNEEAQSVGELNMRHSHATHDLYNRIRDGNPPEWTWYVQTMPVDTNPEDIGFDPLDDTKVRRLISFSSYRTPQDLRQSL